jgi:3-phosphoshikimate 1-carboxyvinyltransferase
MVPSPPSTIAASQAAPACTVSADSLPLRVGGALAGGAYALPGNVSSQYITGLLLALPLLQEDSVLRLTTPASSAGYLDITAAVLAQSGVAVQPFEENGLRGWRIPGGQPDPPP